MARQRNGRPIPASRSSLPLRTARVRGFALIVTLGMLALLAVLASAFTLLSSTEARVAASFTDQVRARMLAFSGIEKAIIFIRGLAMQRATDSLGEPWATTWTPAAGPGTPIDRMAIHNLVVPSFQEVAGGVDPPGALGPIPRGISNHLDIRGTHHPRGDYFVLKIRDAASLLNLNQFDMSISADQRRLAGMMFQLGAAISVEYTLPNPVPTMAVAAQIVDRLRPDADGNPANGRQDSKIPSKQALTPLLDLPALMTQADLDVFSEFVTTIGWYDRSLFRPTPTHPISNVILNPAPASFVINNMVRSPVNINTAPVPVLTAVFAGLDGFRTGTDPFGTMVRGTQPVTWQKQQMSAIAEAITFAQARTLAQAIAARRSSAAGPFRTWHEVEDWLMDTAIMTTPPNILNKHQKAMILAGANPNLRWNKWCPDATQFPREKTGTSYALNPVASFDKLDLMYRPSGASSSDMGGTTELCFSSMGYYEVESLGRVSVWDGAAEQVFGSALIAVGLKVFDVARHTTQQDFLGRGGFAANGVPTDPLKRTRIPSGCSNARTGPESIRETKSPATGETLGDHVLADMEAGGGMQRSRYSGAIGMTTEWDNTVRTGQVAFAPFRADLSFKNPDGSGNRLGPRGGVFDNTERNDRPGAPGGATPAPTIAPHSLLQGNDLLPDGVAGWRHPPTIAFEQETSYWSSETGPSAIWPSAALGQSGVIDMWLRLSRPPNDNPGSGVPFGGDELLAYSVYRFDTTSGQAGTLGFTEVMIDPGDPDADPPVPPTWVNEEFESFAGGSVTNDWGWGWKLERYGNDIVSTRFLWGLPERERFVAPRPEANINFCTLAYTEASVSLANIGQGEWFRISHRWFDGTDQELRLNGAPGAVGPRIQRRVDRTVNGFRLITLERPDTAAPADGLFQVGGASWTPERSGNIYERPGSAYTAGAVSRRFANVAIDDIRIGSDAMSGDPKVSAPRQRYPTTLAGPAGTRWRGQFPFSNAADREYWQLPPGRIANMTWSLCYPRRANATDRNPGDLRITLRAGLGGGALKSAPNSTLEAGVAAVPNLPTVADGGGWALDDTASRSGLPNPGGAALEYEIWFSPGTVNPLTVTPYLDDLTISVLGVTTYQYLYFPIRDGV